MAEARNPIAGKYRLIRVLASGGMGSVWRARHVELDMDVALKLINHDLLDSAIALERFQREARAAAQLRSVHVVQMKDYGVHEGSPYLVMELLDGQDLRQALAAEGPLPRKRAVEIVRQVAKALRLAHDAKIVHRDLKPANIFLCPDGSGEVVKVLDFGVAKVASPSPNGARTTTGTLLGSPLYMSPEQARGASVDHRADLWALGIVAYEIVTGQHPLRGSAIGDILVRLCTEDFPAPSSIGVDSPGLDAFFERALARDPDCRFQSAQELADTFAMLSLGESKPVVAQQPEASRDTMNGGVVGREQVTIDLPSGAAGVTVGVASEAKAEAEVEVEVRRGPARRAWLWLASIVGITSVAIAAVKLSAPGVGEDDLGTTPSRDDSALPAAFTSPPGDSRTASPMLESTRVIGSSSARSSAGAAPASAAASAASEARGTRYGASAETRPTVVRTAVAAPPKRGARDPVFGLPEQAQ